MKIPASNFADFDKAILKLWRGKRPRIPNKILMEKNQVGGLILPDFKICYKATLVRTACYFLLEICKNMDKSRNIK